VIIGHINLAKSFNGTGEHFIALVEALDRMGIKQHIIVQNQSLANRLAVYDGVSLGPVTGSPVIAYCLMPQIDVVHTHDERSGQAGLLLTLARSIPYVLTRRLKTLAVNRPLLRSVYGRAATVICMTGTGARAIGGEFPAARIDVINDIARTDTGDVEMLANRVAADHLRIYHRVVESLRIPALLL
jgi:hypothetical protein